MEEYQFKRICERLDKIIGLLEGLQPSTQLYPTTDIIIDPDWNKKLTPNFEFEPTWAPDVSSTAVESDR